MPRVEVIEKCMEPRYEGEYLYTAFNNTGGSYTGMTRRIISPEVFKQMLGNRPGWVKSEYLNKDGHTVPYVIRFTDP